jgi:hypothetical protein
MLVRTLVVLTTLAPLPAHAGLLAAYGFDEGSGTILHDTSGSGRNGTLYGSPLPAWVTGQPGHGKALSYPGGQSAGVLLGGQNTFDKVSQGTIEAWVKFNTAAGGSYWMWLDNRDASRGCYHSLELSYERVGSTVYAEVWGGNASSGCEPPSFQARVALANPGSWHYIAYVVTATGNALYVDGVIQTPTYVSGSASSTFFLDDAGVGSQSISDAGGPDLSTEQWNGQIDDLRIWDTVRTGTQIAEDMRTPVSTRPRCSDGIDNDGDGATDFPMDFGCSSASGDTELQSPGCGLGFELAVVTPLLAWLRLRRSARA